LCRAILTFPRPTSHTRAVGRRFSRRARGRCDRAPEPLDIRTLVAVEAVCLLAWALTGVTLAFFPAVVAGLGLVLAAVTPEQPLTRRRRRVR
jgi:hypothetical protein